MRISDWSSDVCSSDLGFSMEYVRKFIHTDEHRQAKARNVSHFWEVKGLSALGAVDPTERVKALDQLGVKTQLVFPNTFGEEMRVDSPEARAGCIRYNDHAIAWSKATGWRAPAVRSEEHTSELQSLMLISYAVF